jgi:hypothetical protein
MFKLAYAPQTPTTEAAAAPLKEESTSSETAATGPETQPAVAATQQSPDSTIRHRQTTTQPNATTATRTTVQLGSNSNINNNNRGRLLDALIAVIIFILGILIIRRILIWLYPAYMYFNSNL